MLTSKLGILKEQTMIVSLNQNQVNGSNYFGKSRGEPTLQCSELLKQISQTYSPRGDYLEEQATSKISFSLETA